MSYNAPDIIGKVDGAVVKDRVKIVSVYCSTVTTVAAGVPIALDPADTTYGLGKTFKVNVVDDNPLMAGITVEAKTVTTGQPVGKIKIQVEGPIQAADTYNPTAQGTINLGDAVGGNNSTTAKTIKAVGTCAASIQPFARAIKAYTSGQADGALWLCNPLAL